MNIVMIIGRLTRDPEIKYTASNTAICNFSVAIDREKDKDGNDRRADFPRVIVFGRQAENCNKYLAKGRQVGIEGRIQTGSYENKNGDKVYTTDVIANRVEFLSSNSNAGTESTGSGAAPHQTHQQTSMNTPPEFEEIPDDDIPF